MSTAADDLFAQLETLGHEQLVLGHDPASGYRGIIAIHDTTLGPALGGTRYWTYATTAEAVHDALRLARGMTYKAALAGLDQGGGKAVIMADPRSTSREALFRAHGRFVETLGGRYISAADVGTTEQDMEYVRAETRHVSGLRGQSGDPSPMTAWGVFCGIVGAAAVRWGSDTLAGRTVLVQGAGKVASTLCEHLHEAGARLVVSDIDAGRAERLAAQVGGRVVAPERIYDEPGDVFAPCALGAVLNAATIPRLAVQIVAGGANNQLATDADGDLLAARGVTYAPDYVVNAGGIINIARERFGWTFERAREKTSAIRETVIRVLERAAADGVPPHLAADRLAEARIAAVRGVRGLGARV